MALSKRDSAGKFSANNKKPLFDIVKQNQALSAA